ncbi:unnamed protein product [Adineta steineri]|uniref:Calpain catalytic domain-containing protein n=1 Tax=Adineta steineri TaxID=433720 RepID=A0A814NXC4_9BILA|nr:unnamed protein product [Adineta steineri]CAF1203943.1 unnamed protein product [Adineta steineri]CAF1287908.1 unnamed protein product [Adineta steineri]
MSAAQRQEKDEIDAECKFIDLVHYCRDNRIHFVDDSFIPSTCSINSDSTNPSTYEWLRIRDISSSQNDSEIPWTVMSNPHPNDIEQGALGNCWFMAALSLITERPRMLSHILLTSTVNEEGIYLVRICHNGWWKIVILDDCFPCTASKQLVYAKARRRQLFVPLVEKACAKVWGSYASVIGGFMTESLQLLTGAPSEQIAIQTSTDDDDDNFDLLWTKIISACTANLLMGADTPNTNVPDEEYTRIHLAKNHVFSVLAYYVSSQTERFLFIRNPHGSSKYTDDSISTKIREELHSTKQAEAANGTFWMSWIAFQKYFGRLTICAYRDDLFDVRFEGEFTRHAAQTIQSYYFRLERSSTITVGLFHQHSNRQQHNIHHTQAFVLCDIANNQIGQQRTFLCGIRSKYNEWTETLSAGAYILIPFSTSYWHQERKQDDEIKYTLVIHSLIQLDVMATEDLGKVLADCLIAYAMQHHKNALRFIVGENMSTTGTFNVTINTSTSLNIRHSRNSMITFDSIPTQHRQLHCLCEYISVENQSAKVKYTWSYTHTNAEQRTSEPTINRADDIHAPRPILLQ